MVVKFAPSFLKDLKSQPTGVLDQVKEVIIKLQAADALSKVNLDIKKMQGGGNYYRIRTGNYRIIAELIKPEILLLVIGSRGDVYK